MTKYKAVDGTKVDVEKVERKEKSEGGTRKVTIYEITFPGGEKAEVHGDAFPGDTFVEA